MPANRKTSELFVEGEDESFEFRVLGLWLTVYVEFWCLSTVLLWFGEFGVYISAFQHFGL